MRNNLFAKLLAVFLFVELIAIHLIDLFYLGVIKTWLFDITIILLLLSFVLLKEVGRGRFIGYIVLLVFIPVIFIFNLPVTTYEGGKVIVQEEISNGDVTFIATNYRLIPTTPLESWFIDDYFYHYEVEVSGEILFYIVSPYNGDLYELEEDFFKYYR